MSLHIYNPAAPHGDPVRGYTDQLQGEKCGTCVSCPRDWLVDCGAVSPPYNEMGGKHRLVRELTSFKTHFDVACLWSCAVLLDPINTHPPYQWGDFGIWRLYYGAPPEVIGTGPVDWWLVADVRGFNTPNDIAGWLPNEPANPIAGAHWTQPNFNCLGPNTFFDFGGGDLGGLGFPHTITVKPLWA